VICGDATVGGAHVVKPDGERHHSNLEHSAPHEYKHGTVRSNLNSDALDGFMRAGSGIDQRRLGVVDGPDFDSTSAIALHGAKAHLRSPLVLAKAPASALIWFGGSPVPVVNTIGANSTPCFRLGDSALHYLLSCSPSRAVVSKDARARHPGVLAPTTRPFPRLPGGQNAEGCAGRAWPTPSPGPPANRRPTVHQYPSSSAPTR
jgi:hypothetical protein